MNKNIKQFSENTLVRTQRELNVLYEISCAMRTTLELKNILHIILTGVTSHTGLGYNRAALFLTNTRDRTLECKMAIGPESEEHATQVWKYIEECTHNLEDLIQANKIQQSISSSRLYNALKELQPPLTDEPANLLGSAYHKGIPWHILSDELQNFPEDTFLKIFRTKELLIMPLRIKDHINGLIVTDNIYTKKPITQEDIRIFSMLADQAALAIENSRLYEMVVQKSHTDSLTNLWNHGFFQEKLSEEIAEAQTTELPLSLAIIDIDNFKRLNDTYGHQAGDLILKELAELLKESSRDKDYVCRYGGEEFSIILIETNEQQSFDIAERLRKKIADHPFSVHPETLQKQQPQKESENINITVSIGLATYPDHAQTKESLIANADKAMYIAKFSGKNKTCLTEL